MLVENAVSGFVITTFQCTNVSKTPEIWVCLNWRFRNTKLKFHDFSIKIRITFPWLCQIGKTFKIPFHLQVFRDCGNRFQKHTHWVFWVWACWGIAFLCQIYFLKCWYWRASVRADHIPSTLLCTVLKTTPSNTTQREMAPFDKVTISRIPAEDCDFIENPQAQTKNKPK